MKYKSVIFDLDGTLLYTLEDLKIAVNHALLNHGYPARNIEQIRQSVGNGNKNLLALSVEGGEDNPDFPQMFEEYVSYYLSHDTVTTKPYDGIVEVISYCKSNGIKLGVISNKLQAATEHLVEHYFPGDFDLILGDDGKRARKPDRAVGEYALNILSSDNTNTLYIGDSLVDARFAKNMEMDCILCAYGFCPSEELAKESPLALVNKASEILNYIS